MILNRNKIKLLNETYNSALIEKLKESYFLQLFK